MGILINLLRRVLKINNEKNSKDFYFISLISIFLLLGFYQQMVFKPENLMIFYQRINNSNNNVKTRLNDIKFKLDIKELSLFLETKNPVIIYRNTPIPTKI